MPLSRVLPGRDLAGHILDIGPKRPPDEQRGVDPFFVRLFHNLNRADFWLRDQGFRYRADPLANVKRGDQDDT